MAYKVIRDLNYIPEVSRIAKHIGKENLESFNKNQPIEVDKKTLDVLKSYRWAKLLKKENKENV